jgi:hypothetical protein
MSWLRTPRRRVFFVRSAEQNFCPCCDGTLKVIGSRQRKFINSAGDKEVLIIRRLRCLHCGRIHHELPDILLPYKRYGSESIEAAVNGNSDLCVAADESTIARWRKWFLERANYLLGCLTSIAFRFGKGSVESMICLPKSAFQRIWHYVGDAPGWLARVVRPIANSNLWPHTRSAFCP